MRFVGGALGTVYAHQGLLAPRCLLLPTSCAPWPPRQSDGMHLAIRHHAASLRHYEHCSEHTKVVKGAPRASLWASAPPAVVVERRAVSATPEQQLAAALVRARAASRAIKLSWHVLGAARGWEPDVCALMAAGSKHDGRSWSLIAGHVGGSSRSRAVLGPAASCSSYVSGRAAAAALSRLTSCAAGISLASLSAVLPAASRCTSAAVDPCWSLQRGRR